MAVASKLSQLVDYSAKIKTSVCSLVSRVQTGRNEQSEDDGPGTRLLGWEAPSS